MNKPVTFFLLRGLARETRHWVDFPEQLERSGKSNLAAPLEIPGAGALRAIQAPLNIAEYIPVLRKQYLEKISPERDNLLIGLSLGGMLAAQWVHEHPNDFNGVVLINSSCNSSRLLKRLQPGAAATLILAAAHRDCFRQEQKIAERICNLTDTNEIAGRWAELYRDAPMKTGNKLRQIIAAMRFTLPPRPATPALVLCAENDRLASHSCSIEIARHWDAPVFCHDSAGHDLPTDDPHWCTETILSWYGKPH